MRRSPSYFAFAAVAAGLVSLVTACSGGQVVVGKTDQQLKTRGDGSPSGNGQTCSWEDVGGYPVDSVYRGPYNIGDEFKSPDGCNDCSCTTQGIVCTDRACPNNPGGGGAICDDDARMCPDGTSVGRGGPNCEFAPCPVRPCTTEAKECPDGTHVGRGGPNCEFAPCPGF